MRGIAFWLVLIGHSFPDSSYGFVNSYSKFVHEFIYSFHMPLFFVISGFCMKPLLDKGEVNVKFEIEKRCKRLIIPYLFYSYLAVIPKLLFNTFMYLPFERNQLWAILVGKSPSGTLWYVWNLFMINIIFLFISRITKNRYIWLFISLIMYIGYMFFPTCYFNRLLEYPLFFILGVFLAVYYKPVFEWLRSRGVLIIFFLLINGFIVFAEINVEFVCFVTAILGSISMLYLAIKITSSKGKIYSFLKMSGMNSYGIYLMSPYVMVAIRVFCYKSLGLPYLVCMIGMLVLGFLVPFGVMQHVIRKSSLLSGIMLGEW